MERQRGQAANLQSNDKRLGDLISGLETEIARQAELARRAELKGSDYRVNVRVWLADDGQLHRIELASSSGDPQTDRLLQEALTRLPAIDQVPSNLPQPLSMRITNRVTG